MTSYINVYIGGYYECNMSIAMEVLLEESIGDRLAPVRQDKTVRWISNVVGEGKHITPVSDAFAKTYLPDDVETEHDAFYERHKADVEKIEAVMGEGRGNWHWGVVAYWC